MAEIGVDMTRFQSDRHLASWASLCTGNHESAGKRETGQDAEGQSVVADGAHRSSLAAIRTKDSALAARYRRVRRHRGDKKAVVAVAQAILREIYHMLTDHSP